MFKIPFKNFNFNIKQCLKCLKKKGNVYAQLAY